MAKEIYSYHSDPFFMTGAECARFMGKRMKKIASRLRGKKEDVDDAIAEVVCKCLGAKLGTGSVLKWKDDPFETARTEDQWIAFLAWQCRSRLNVIRAMRKYWFDPDVIRQFVTVDDVDGVTPVEQAAAIEAESYEGSDDLDEGPVDDQKAEDEESAADDVESGVGGKPNKKTGKKDSPADEKLYRQHKIVEYLAAEADRMCGNYYPIPGKSYEDDVNYKAACSVLADMVKNHSVSRRDLEIWVNSVMYRRARLEVAQEFGVKPNNLDQIVYRVKEYLKIVGPTLHRAHARRIFHEAA